ADLVRAAGLGPELDQRAAVALGQQPPVGDRGFALARGDHPPALLRAADLAQRQLDRALGLLRDARQYAEVALADLPRLKREGEAPERLRVAGEKQAARGVGIEPVDRHGRPLEAEPERVEMVLERRPAAARPLDRQ